eukprot:TRINITY_DN42503_c0_g1_i1.p1 TRINITY_DN42503_c0_g1~~TRINITY_DN42503_c0_g1_i1.p1  ORF type:complete len:213 (-),score=24.83 TRINITY_DN42503_c0_g1_i1:290-928(-)
MRLRAQYSCHEDDALFAQWSALRVSISGLIVCSIINARVDFLEDDSLWYFPVAYAKAAYDYLTTEGTGMTVYFISTIIMEEVFIFFEHSSSGSHCSYVKAVALSSTSWVVFLPVLAACCMFQRRIYHQDAILWKLTFTLLIALLTCIFFAVRFFLVLKFGYLDWLSEHMSTCDHRVLTAVIVPTFVDALETVLLIIAAKYSRINAENEANIT